MTADPPSPEALRRATLDLTRRALSSVAEGTITVSGETQSMAPVLRGGEVLHWRRPEAPPRFGDVLIFLHPPGPVVHRVIGRDARGGWRTKGDSRPGADVKPVAPDEILGIVFAIESGGTRRRLGGAPSRFYGVLAASWSRFGHVLNLAAYLGDAVLRRLPSWGDRRVFRAPTHWVQRGGALLLYRALFALCHPEVR